MRREIHWRSAVIVLAILFSRGSAAPNALAEVSARFKAVSVLQTLSETIQRGFNNKRALARNCSCALHACSNLLKPHEVCTDRLGTADACGETCTTRKVSLERGFVTTPPGTDPLELSPRVVEESCIYQTLEDAFLQYEPSVYSWLYFGAVGGVTITYPGVASARGVVDGPNDPEFGNCEQYDPRTRPWYSDATSAPKDIILLMDASSSMNNSVRQSDEMTRWDLAKDVATCAVDLLHFADEMRVVILSEEHADQENSPKLIDATDSNKEKMKTLLNAVSPSGGKLTERGFKTAFDTFQRVQREEIKSTGCQRVVVWITDGYLCSDEDETGCKNEVEIMQEILQVLEDGQESLHSTEQLHEVTIFVITVGDNSDCRLPQHITCRHRGIHTHIQPGLDILEQLLPYVSFLAGQLREKDDRITWSRFYEDFSGLGLMTTATRPMFSHGETGPRKGRLLGVIGYDIPLTMLEDNGLGYSEVVGQLSRHIGQCTVYPIDPCQLQILRMAEAECSSVHPAAACYEKGEGGRVYLVVRGEESRLMYDEAVQRCQEMNGELAESQSAKDQRFLSGLVDLDAAWIGLRQLSKASEWQWRSGKERGHEKDDTFWSMTAEQRSVQGQCAAMDGRGTRHNVEPHDCNERLDYICEFPSIEAAPGLCKDDTHLIRPSTAMPSIESCIEDGDALIDVEFMNIRRRENEEPVFCPMQLEDILPNEEALCCEECRAQDAAELTSAEAEKPNLSATASSVASSHGHAPILTLLVCFLSFLIGLIV